MSNLRTKERFLKELEIYHEKSYAIATKLDANTFFARPEAGWSVAENYIHMAKVLRSMALIFAPISVPLIALMGKSNGNPPSLEQFMKDYHSGLEKGFHSGPFAPARENPNIKDPVQRQNEILLEWRDSFKPMAARLEGFTGDELMKKQFYHPILGKVILMDMAYMAIFHSMHHLKKASRKAGTNLLPPSLF